MRWRKREKGKEKERKREREEGRGGGRRERKGMIIHIIREWSPENCSCSVADRLR